MFRVNRSLLGNAISIFAIKLFPAVANVAVVILFSRQLSQTDYGHYQNFWVRLLMLGTIACLGLPAFIITYSPDVLKQLAGYIRKWQYRVFVAWCIVFSAVFSFFEWSEIELPVLLTASLLLLYIIHAIQESLLFAAQKLGFVSLISFLYSVYFLVIHVYVLSFGYSLETLLGFIFTGMIVRSVFYIPLLSKAYGQKVSGDLPIAIMQKARTLWMHLGFYDFTQIVFRWLDKFLISFFLSAALSAVYFNGSIDIPFLPVLIGAVSSATLVQLASQNNRSDEMALSLMKRTSRLLACIVFPVFFFFLFFCRPLFEIVFSGKYNEAIPVFIVGLFFLPLRAYNYTSLLQYLHQGKLINKGAILDLVIAFGLFYPMYHFFGLPGAALSFVLSTYIQVGYYLFHLSRLLNKPFYAIIPIRNWILKFIVYGMVSCLFYYFLKDQDDIIQLVAGFVIMVLMAGISFWMEWKKMRRDSV